MNIAVTQFTPEFAPVLPEAYQTKRAIYFDIETTGLSAQSSYVYLIGCANEEAEGYVLTQWLCTDPSEEKELLRLFFEKVKDYDVVLHYNGTGFDLPFLEKKAKRHCLQNPLSSMESLDLYATARSLKHLFDLPNLKLKTMEQFFGFTRTDVFSGGDLIEVYAQFLGLHHLNSLTNRSKAEEENALAQVLLLHNAEDIMNLPALTVLCFLQNLSSELTPERLYRTPSASSSEYPKLAEALSKITLTSVACSVEYQLPFTLPRTCKFAIPFDGRDILLTLSVDGSVMLLLPTVTGELKYFHPNPADYYYLPLEDCAMHKSVASFVEKEYRQKATAATCYTKKTGTFVPLRLLSPAKKSGAADNTKKEAQTSLPCFLSDYKSKYAYTPFTEELRSEAVLLTVLAKELLDTLL